MILIQFEINEKVTENVIQKWIIEGNAEIKISGNIIQVWLGPPLTFSGLSGRLKYRDSKRTILLEDYSNLVHLKE